MTTTAQPTALPTVLAAVREELAVAAPEVPADASADALLVAELGVDSLALLELVARLELRYGIAVPDADWPLLTTLDEVAAYLAAATGDPS